MSVGPRIKVEERKFILDRMYACIEQGMTVGNAVRETWEQLERAPQFKERTLVETSIRKIWRERHGASAVFTPVREFRVTLNGKGAYRQRYPLPDWVKGRILSVKPLSKSLTMGSWNDREFEVFWWDAERGPGTIQVTVRQE